MIAILRHDSIKLKNSAARSVSAYDKTEKRADVEAVFEHIEQMRRETEEDRKEAWEEEWGD